MPFSLPHAEQLGSLPAAAAFILIVVGTWVAEDPVLVLSATAWALGGLSFGFVLGANVVGISSGDLLLYGLGRRFGHHLPGLPWIGRLFHEEALLKGERFFRRRGLQLVLLARFVPGLRLPTYTAAGVFRAPWRPTTALIVLSGLVWVPLQMMLVRGLSAGLGRVPGFLAALALFMVLAWVAQGFMDQGWERRWWALRRVGRYEFWPPWLFYAPLAPGYLALGLWHGHLLLPTLADPGLDGGGLIGESKNAVLDALPRRRAWTLPHRRVVPGSRAADLLAWARRKGLRLPLVLKPDQGQRGSGVRLCRDRAALEAVLAAARYELQAQAYCPFDGEAGIFYARPPWGGPGRILSLTEKRFPTVQGDGRRTLARLILDHPRARWACETYFHRFQARLDEVLPRGRRLRLVESGNHAQGAHFLDGRRLLSSALSAKVDALARAIPGFYAGRFDVRYKDEAALRAGRFKLIEVNGAGAEMTHIWDPDYPLWRAYRDLYGQWRLLFAYGAWQRDKMGLKPMGYAEFLRRAWAYRKLSKLHPDAT